MLKSILIVLSIEKNFSEDYSPNGATTVN